jgi:uncharacterized protein YqeY
MDLIEQLEADLGEAMKLRDEVRTTTLRLLKSALKNYQIELGHDLTMQEALSVLQKEAKKHQDSIKQYEAADRDDLANEEKAELEVIEKYLPEQMSREELEKIVEEAISSLNASGPSDMGKVIGMVRAKTEGKADGSMIAEIAKQKLAN